MRTVKMASPEIADLESVDAQAEFVEFVETDYGEYEEVAA